jgi:hypothetical protein
VGHQPTPHNEELLHLDVKSALTHEFVTELCGRLENLLHFLSQLDMKNMRSITKIKKRMTTIATFNLILVVWQSPSAASAALVVALIHEV